MRIPLGYAAAILLCLAQPAPAAAQYSPDFFSGSELLPPKSSQRTLLADHTALAKARRASGKTAHVVGLFELKPGPARHFDFASPLMEQPDFITETVLAPTKGGVSPVALASYRGPQGRVVLGLGDVPAEWDPAVRRSTLFSYWAEPHGKFKEVARHSVDSGGAAGAYVLDLTGTGVISVAIPWATGAGGGGGVEVITVVPTGGLAGFGPNLDEYTLPAQTGGCELADLDGDGAWEIETTQPLLCSACGYDIGQAWTYDPQHYGWIEDEARFPDFYRPQRDFYAQLLVQVQAFRRDPVPFQHQDAVEDEERYTCSIDGATYTLWPFMPLPDDGADNAAQWLGLLQDYVSGQTPQR